MAGTLADKYGRKKLCLAFGVLYSISCVTKHFPNFSVLMFGRLMGGICTSILFSAFESWMIHEHHEKTYAEDWLGLTYSISTSGNAIVAIISGVVASFAKTYFGPVAPFDVSLCFLLASIILISVSWKENYGDASIDLSQTFKNAVDRIQSDRKIAVLGLVQSLFEGAMYIFVFMWTPALESTTDHPVDHGWIFASFMICVFIGSELFRVFLERKERVERTAVYVFGVAAFALFLPVITTNHSMRLISFFIFEGCVGMFWPSIGFLRSRYVPEDVRATVMNIFRIPLNIIVVVVLFNIGNLSEVQVFLACLVCLILAMLFQMQLVSLTVESPDIGKKSAQEGEQAAAEEPLITINSGAGGQKPPPPASGKPQDDGL